MDIDLSGFGYYRIRERNYLEFKEILNIDDDLLLDLIHMDKLGVVSILCINIDNITKEGPIDFGYLITDIGKERFIQLIKENVIEKLWFFKN